MTRTSWLAGASLSTGRSILALAGLAVLGTAAPTTADDIGGAGIPIEAFGLAGQSTAAAGGRETMPLSLGEAVALSIENNLNVEVARHAPLIAWERNRQAWGSYDPEAKVETAVSSTETPTASLLQLGGRAEDEVWTNSTGLSGLLPVLSTQYEMKFGADRTKTNRSIEQLREKWDSSLQFSVTQPLLRNLYWNEAWTEVKVSKTAFRRSEEEFRTALMDVVEGVENAYWAAVATGQRERVAIKSRETSNKLLEQTKVQYEVGVVSKVEVVEAEAGVAERDVQVIRAKNQYRDSQDQLIDAVLGAQLIPGSRLEIQPTDEPEEYQAFVVDEEQATAKGMVNRPELAAADRDIREKELKLSFATNQVAPQIDLVASYGYKGLSGKPCDPNVLVGIGCTPASAVAAGAAVDASLRHSVEDFFDHDGAVNWSVGGVFSVPLGNHTRRAQRRSAKIELRQARTQRVRVVQDIILEIRAAARNLESAIEGIEAAERRRIAAEEQFRAESIRLEQGESTPFDVLERERDLVEAEVQKIEAFQVYHNSVAELERAQGTILSRHNIVLDDARRLR